MWQIQVCLRDKTKDIAKNLAKDYEVLKVASWKECRDIMDNVDEN